MLCRVGIKHSKDERKIMKPWKAKRQYEEWKSQFSDMLHCQYSEVSLTGISDNETPDSVIPWPDKFYPELNGSRYPEFISQSG